MNNEMYWVSAITYVIVLGIILLNDMKIKKTPNREEKSFRIMTTWVILFCVQDTVWGLCSDNVIKNDCIFFISSMVFHTSTVLTTFFWLNYVLVYLEKSEKQKRLFFWLDGLVIFFQLILIFINISSKALFYIENGRYMVGPLRPFTFINQYIVYVVIGAMALIRLINAKKEEYKKYIAVFIFTLAPIILGVCQLLVVEAPFYSLGYFLGCFIVHIFIVSKEHEEAEKKKQMEWMLKSNYDELTGLYNRRAFESALTDYYNKEIEDNFVFISMDVNELKVTNDSLGHAAGDELLIGATQCMKKCFGSYGNIYRTGGDEFNAIIFTDRQSLEKIKKDFNETLENWSGSLVKSISISCGYLTKSEVESPNIKEISVLADKRMYDDKARFYHRKGVDRRGQKDVHAALCALYTKILKINITEDSYQIVNIDSSEHVSADKVPAKLSDWFLFFAENGNVHTDDLQEYLNKTSLVYIKHYFADKQNDLKIFYRRKYDNDYKQVMMEIIRANDYSDENQSLFLYVKCLD